MKCEVCDTEQPMLLSKKVTSGGIEDTLLMGECCAPELFGFVVTCEDGKRRHPSTFQTRRDAVTWAEYGHLCTAVRTHLVEPVEWA